MGETGLESIAWWGCSEVRQLFESAAREERQHQAEDNGYASKQVARVPILSKRITYT